MFRCLFLVSLVYLSACSTIQTINGTVNQFQYIRDIPDDNRWASRQEFFSGRYGRDCEDFALEKARRLIKRGFSLDRLAIWTVDDDLSDGKTHAVLVVDDRYVLDNKYFFVYSVEDADWTTIISEKSLKDNPSLLKGVRFEKEKDFNL